jgi:hypothetical protein
VGAHHIDNAGLLDGKRMNELMTNFTWGGLLLLLFHTIYPEAAVGAVCGSMFFWSLSPEIPVFNRFFLALASIGFGYGMGLPAAQSVSYTGWTLVTAAFGASLVHVVIVSLQRTVNKDSPMPPWLTGILDILPWTRKGGDK